MLEISAHRPSKKIRQRANGPTMKFPVTYFLPNTRSSLRTLLFPHHHHIVSIVSIIALLHANAHPADPFSHRAA